MDNKQESNSVDNKELTYNVYCRIEDGTWHKVHSQDQNGVLILPHASKFSKIWNDPEEPEPLDSGKLLKKSWNELLIPLPDESLTCWGYALTYPLHRKEMKLNKWFSFGKIASAVNMSAQIIHRPYLDFEAEIGLLTHVDCPDRFGYIMVNDLTDREIQIKTYNPRNPMPSFLKAKSFEGSLGVGPLLLIGDENSWNDLELDLSLNGINRQKVRAKDCLLKPIQFHADVFLKKQNTDWALVATGTGGGVLFRPPNILEKLLTFTKAGFSTERTKNLWLEKLIFLKPGDRIEFFSKILGYSSSTIEEVFRFRQ